MTDQPSDLPILLVIEDDEIYWFALVDPSVNGNQPSGSPWMPEKTNTSASAA